MRASALGPAPDQVACPRVRAEIVAVLGLQEDETDLGLREVRVEREGALLRGRGALQVLGGLRAIQAVLGLVEISLAERRPGRGIFRIEPDGPLEHRHGLLVLPGIAREGLAAEVEVVRFRALRVRRRSARVGAGAQGRQQALAHALQQLLGQRDHVGGRRRRRVPPDDAISLGVDDLHRYAEPVALLLELAREDARRVELAARGLRVDVLSGVSPGGREGAHREPGGVGQRRGDLVGKSEAQVVDLAVSQRRSRTAERR